MLFNPYYLLFLPAISGWPIIPGLPGSVNRIFRKIMAVFSHSLRGGIRCAPPVLQLTKYKIPLKLPFIMGVWEFFLDSCPAGPGAPSTNPQSPTEVGNIREFGS